MRMCRTLIEGWGPVLIEVLCALASTRRLVAFAWPVPGLRLIHAP